MARQCNIDRHGRVMRVRIGFGLVGIGLLALFAWALPLGSRLGWGIAVLLLAAGVFSWIEARLGWCAARAMGIRTRF